MGTDSKKSPIALERKAFLPVRVRLRPNPSFERTRHGSPLQAFILFWALRVLPRRASQLKR